jgi:hypothetical protein
MIELQHGGLAGWIEVLGDSFVHASGTSQKTRRFTHAGSRVESAELAHVFHIEANRISYRYAG